MILSQRSIAMAATVFLTFGANVAYGAGRDASRLGHDLTPVGAERAGNTNGSIPAWRPTPVNAPVKGGVRSNPFASDVPRLKITAADLARHVVKLTEGTKEILKRNPDTFHLNVYPTRRVAVFPDRVAKMTRNNVATAALADGGLRVTDVHGGYPFPIPKNAHEVMWNHLLRYEGDTTRHAKFDAYYVAAGKRVYTVGAIVYERWPYQTGGDTMWTVRIDYSAPARRAGAITLGRDPMDIAGKGRKAWQYLPGQRRVKRAPRLAFDTPNPVNGGITTYDDAYMFNGSMELYNWKLLGKKEMYVPYNNYDMQYRLGPDEIYGDRHVKPEAIRWELHRVWVVEATVKPGKRHKYRRRTFYVDEDTWTILASDQYGDQGKLVRAGYHYTAFSYDVGASNSFLQCAYDLESGAYYLTGVAGPHGGIHYTDRIGDDFFQPNAVSGSGVR